MAAINCNRTSNSSCSWDSSSTPLDVLAGVVVVVVVVLVAAAEAEIVVSMTVATTQQMTAKTNSVNRNVNALMILAFTEIVLLCFWLLFDEEEEEELEVPTNRTSHTESSNVVTRTVTVAPIRPWKDEEDDEDVEDSVI